MLYSSYWLNILDVPAISGLEKVKRADTANSHCILREPILTMHIIAYSDLHGTSCIGATAAPFMY